MKRSLTLSLTYLWRILKFLLLLVLILLPQFSLLLPKYLPTNFSHPNLAMWGFFLTSYALVLFCLIWQYTKFAPQARHLKKFTHQDVIMIATSFFALYGLKYIYVLLLPTSSATQNDAAISKMFSLSVSVAFMMAFITAIMAPICEELLFRGIFMSYFFKNYAWCAIFFSGLVFGLIHVHAGDNYLVPLLYCSIGWILAYSYRKTNNILVSITIHFLNNFLPAIALLISSLSQLMK